MADTRNTSSGRNKKTGVRLDTPGRKTRLLPPLRIDGDEFGRFAEMFARFMGTAQFLFWMSVFIAVWIGWNIIGPAEFQFDEYPFIFLTLMLSLQASYAAPLILLAQNRQEARDRIAIETDRKVAAQSRADMEFLARELASARMNLGEMATREFIRSELKELAEEMRQQAESELREKIEAEIRAEQEPRPDRT